MHFLFTNKFMYLNPGTGSLIAQLLAAFVLGSGILIRVFWSRIKVLFTGKKPEPTEKEEDDVKND